MTGVTSDLEFHRAAPGDAAAIAEVHVRSHLETYGALPDGWSIEIALEKRLSLWTRVLGEDGAAFVANEGNRVIGFGHAVGDRLTTLYLLAAYQRSLELKTTLSRLRPRALVRVRAMSPAPRQNSSRRSRR